MRGPARRCFLLLSLGLAVDVTEPSAFAQPSPPFTLPLFQGRNDPGSGKWSFSITRLDQDVLSRLVEARTAQEAWSSLCEFHLVPEGGRLPPDHPRLLGSYSVHGDGLVFVPRYALATDDRPILRVFLDASLAKGGVNAPARRRDPGRPGRLVFDFDASEAPDAAGGVIPVELTRVDRVYPSAPVLPENLLKFYVHFSAPMSRGESYKHIRLVGPAGKPVADPFLELDEELWSRDQKRYTLLFDPGRIKRGLKPREEAGPILEQGRSYTLEIDKAWCDSRGFLLARSVRVPFTVGPPDETPPDPKAWRIHAPSEETAEPLRVTFDEPLDHALALRLISVLGQGGAAVEGVAALEAKEAGWVFTPRGRWKAGEHNLVVGTDLEDLAGNGVGRPFEVDMVRPISRAIAAETVRLPFRVGPAAR